MGELQDSLKEYLEGLLPSIPIGLDFMGSEKIDMLSIYEYPGSRGPLHTKVKTRRFQIVVKTYNPSEGIAIISKVYTEAFELYNPYLELPGIGYVVINLGAPPTLLKVDDQGGSYYSFNFGITSEQS